jgi:hypothetical protein
VTQFLEGIMDEAMDTERGGSPVPYSSDEVKPTFELKPYVNGPGIRHFLDEVYIRAMEEHDEELP